MVPLHHGFLKQRRFYDGLSASSVAVGTFVVVATLCNPWLLIRFRIASYFIQKKTWVFGKSYVVHVFHVYFGKSICSKFMKSEAVSLIFTKSIEIHCRVSFHLLPGGAIAASMAKKGGASITFPVFLASLMSGCFGRKVTHDP